MAEFSNADIWLHRGWLWQTTLCLVFGGAGSYFFRAWPARAHRVLLVSMLAAVALPLVSHLVHELNWGIVPAPQPLQKAGWVEPAVPAPLTAAAMPSAEAASPLGESAAVDAGRQPPAAAPRSAGVMTGSWFPSDVGDWQTLGLLFWAVFSGCVLLRVLLSFVSGILLLAGAQRLEDASLLEAVGTAAQKLGLRRQPATYLSSVVHCPVMWGFWLRPVLVIPKSATHLTAAALEGIACHELAHWKRRDQWTNLFGWLFAATLPWHPLAWWSQRRLGAFSEQACDDWVLACGQSPAGYAEVLLSLCPQPSPKMALAAVGGRATLKQRIQRILNASLGNPWPGAAWSLGLVLIAAALVAGIALAQRRARRPTHEVQQAPLAVRLEAPGVVAAADEVEIRAEVRGTVLYLIPEGTVCKKGDLLAELDSAPLLQQFHDQKAKVAELQAAAQGAEVALAKLSEDRSRSGLIMSKQREAELRAAQLQLEAQKNRLAELQERVARCKIPAPIDGIVLYHRARSRYGVIAPQEGSEVRERQILLQLFDTSQLRVEAVVDAPFARALKTGEAVRVSVDALPGQTLDGTIAAVNEVPDPAVWWKRGAARHQIVVSLAESHSALRPGLTTVVEVPRVELQQVLQVPLSAVVQQGDRSYCWVRGELGLERRSLALGVRNAQMALVRSGLDAGDQVVLNPRRRAIDANTRPRTGQGPQGRRRTGRQPESRQQVQQQVPQPGQQQQQQADGEPLLTLNFDNAPWTKVLGWLAEQMELTLDTQSVPPGTVQLISRKPKSVDEAFGLVNSLLLGRDFTLVRTKQLLIVTSLENLDPTRLPRITPEQLGDRPQHELVRVFFEVAPADAQLLSSELSPLLSRWGMIVTLRSSGRLDVRDSVGNLLELRQLIEASRSHAADQPQFRVFYLKYVKAEQAAAVLHDALGVARREGADQLGLADRVREAASQAQGLPDRIRSSTRVVVEPRTNSILVRGDVAALEVIERILAVLDVPSGPAPKD